MRALGDRVASADRPPGFIVIASEDDFAPAPLAEETAARLGVGAVTLEGQGHWWMISEPALAADALVDFWAGLT